MRLIEAFFVIFLGFGLLAFGLGSTINSMLSNITSNASLATGDYWELENALLYGGTILGGLTTVFAGVYLAVKKPPSMEYEE